MATKQKFLPVIGLLTAAMVWGVIWYPYRVLAQAGVTGDLSTLLSFVFAMLFGMALLGPIWRELRFAGWWGAAFTLAAGWANCGYVLATLEGEVMRVLLLFYLAPLWTVLFAFFLLGERLNRYGYGIVALSFTGAFVMLWSPQQGWPVPQSRAEWLGLSAGMAFALSNVLSCRLQQASFRFKAGGVWFGTALLTAMLVIYRGEASEQLAMIEPMFWGLLVVIGLVLCASTLIVQYGLTHLSASQSIVLFLFELVVAAAASWLLAHESMGGRELLGAMLIVSASLLSGRLAAAAEKSPS